jgi:hypothetical protein
MISRDAEKKPGQRAAFGIKSLRVANQCHKNFLRHVLSHRCIPAHVQGESVNRRVFTPVKKSECFFVARQHPPKQAVVGDRYGPIHCVALDGLFCFSLHIPFVLPNSSTK